jgi:hypothetical protein
MVYQTVMVLLENERICAELSRPNVFGSRASARRCARHIGVMDIPRFLHVSVDCVGTNRWKWSVSDGAIEMANGHEISKRDAEFEGNAALFVLMSVPNQKRRK